MDEEVISTVNNENDSSPEVDPRRKGNHDVS
jgi:hypothetical protein